MAKLAPAAKQTTQDDQSLALLGDSLISTSDGIYCTVDQAVQPTRQWSLRGQRRVKTECARATRPLKLSVAMTSLSEHRRALRRLGQYNGQSVSQGDQQLARARTSILPLWLSAASVAVRGNATTLVIP